MIAVPSKTEANRRNAQRSTGPRTKRGKENQRRAVTVHGLRCDTPVLSALGETADEWEQHHNEVVESLKATGPVQMALAERVARLLWKGARLDRHETATMQAKLAEIPFVVTTDRDSFGYGERGGYDRLDAAYTELVCCQGRAEALETLCAATADTSIGEDDCEAVLRAALDWVVAPFDRLPDQQSTDLTMRVLNEITGRGVPDPDDSEPDALVGWDAARLCEAVESCVAAQHAVLGRAADDSDAVRELSLWVGVQTYIARSKRDRLREHAAAMTVARAVPTGDVHDRLARYDETIHRALSRTLSELRKLQGT
ncbi:MAG: hypothetical protein AB7K09_16140 [Planctomycetota bacterium]